MDYTRAARAVTFYVIIALAGVGQVSAATLNRIVAVVNNDIITLHELNHKILELTGVPPNDLRFRDEEKYIETRQEILELLIYEKIAHEKVKELGISVARRQIDSAIEKVKKNNQWSHEELISKLKEQGISFENYNEKVKEELERIKLINFEVKSRIVIREEEILKYYEDNKERFRTDGKVRLAGIILVRKNPEDDEELKKLKRIGESILVKLRNGEDFGELAKKNSMGPGAGEGGNLGVFKTSQLEPALKRMIEAIPEGGFSELFIQPGRVQIMKIIKKEEGKLKSFEDVGDAIYGILYKEEVDKRYMSWIKKLRDESYTKIMF